MRKLLILLIQDMGNHFIITQLSRTTLAVIAHSLVLILYLVFVAGAPPVLLAFVATELGGALHQFWALRSSAREARW